MIAAIAYPAIDPIALQLGPLAIRWYGLAYVAGLLGATYVAFRLNRRWALGIESGQFADILLAAALGVIVGARVGYVAFYNPSHYLREPIEILSLWDGGMSFHGGLVGILIAAWVMSRRLGIGFRTMTDLGAVGAPIGLFFGRLANFINGELWGRTTDVSWAMVFPGAGSAPRHPSQLYEALLEGVVIFLVLIVLSRKKRAQGLLTGVMFALYGVFRFAVEFVREPDAQLGFLWGGVTMGQLLTIPVLLAGIALVVAARKAGVPAGKAEIGAKRS